MTSNYRAKNWLLLKQEPLPKLTAYELGSNIIENRLLLQIKIFKIYCFTVQKISAVKRKSFKH